MKHALTFLSALLLTLSACAPGRAPTSAPTAAALLSTHTSAPTATPTHTPSPTATPTATLTATPTATPTPIPTLPPEQLGGLTGVPDPRFSNPELFDLNDPNAPIPQFVHAMQMAGIEVAPEAVASTLVFEYRQYPKRDKDGNAVLDAQGNPVMDEYVFGVWELPADLLPERYQNLAGKIPVIYAVKNADGNWQWVERRQGLNLVPLRLFADALGIKVGPMYDSTEETERGLHLFNASCIPNTGAWSLMEPERGKFKGFDFVKSLIRKAQESGAQPIYGGHLIFVGEYPEWLTNGRFTNEELEQILRTHIRTFMQKFPEIKIWNVVNELQSAWNIDKDSISKQLGAYKLLEIAFGEARKTDPNAVLVFNDSANHAFSGGGYHAETEKDIQMLKFLKERNLVDAVGVQMHINQNPYMLPFTPEGFARVLEAYKELGVQVNITELDVNLYDKTGSDRWLWQAQVYKDIVSTYLQSNAGNVIIFWGLQDNTSWLEGGWAGQGIENADPLLFDDTGKPKIAYYIILKTLYDFANQPE